MWLKLVNRRKSRYIFLIFLFAGCVEPYDFVIVDKEPRLVIEGTISDKSYNETLLYPSDGRRFSVKLTYTSNVSNERVQPVSDASVVLLDDLSTSIAYAEVQSGIYEIMDPDFKAVPERAYKLQVKLSNDEIYESSWERLPEYEPLPVGEIGFSETEKVTYQYVEKEKKVKTIKGIDVFVQVPTRNQGQTTYYRWDYSTHWIFIAPLPPVFSPVKKCWVAGTHYLSDFRLLADHVGGYKANLFFMPTEGNERILEDFTVLVRQKVLSEDYFNFLREMQEQDQNFLHSDRPPYNLKTNFTAVSGGRDPIGYFAVTGEEATRWYFNVDDLSYAVPNNLRQGCQGPPPFVPPPGCNSCIEYQFGLATTVEPDWWRD